ncbi:hypothetical protein EH183_41825 [Streptomyces sp. CB01881]|nr:hypothetical protein EH183_41825 [Streptomyces sp. CB01881]
MNGITFPAWQGDHYVTLAELLTRLGSFGLGLRWRVECTEKWDLTAELERRSAGDGMDALTLLSLVAPGVQLIDAEASGFAEGGMLVVTLTEVDSSFWNVKVADEHVLTELRRHYPGASAL